jgi:hypothetical protein
MQFDFTTYVVENAAFALGGGSGLEGVVQIDFDVQVHALHLVLGVQLSSPPFPAGIQR